MCKTICAPVLTHKPSCVPLHGVKEALVLVERGRGRDEPERVGISIPAPVVVGLVHIREGSSQRLIGWIENYTCATTCDAVCDTTASRWGRVRVLGYYPYSTRGKPTGIPIPAQFTDHSIRIGTTLEYSLRGV